MNGINIITANFSNGGRQSITRKLYQYDYGQKISIKGIKLPNIFEVHISNEKNANTAQIYIGNHNEIEIPDKFLLSGKDIYIWIFLHATEQDGETRYTITIPVQKKPQSKSAEPTPIEKNTIDQLIAALENNLNEIQQATEQAKIEMQDATERAKNIFLKYPKIIEDYWYVYDVENQIWVNTNIKALAIDGVGIENIIYNDNYTITVILTNGNSYTTNSIRGEKGDTGSTPRISIGLVETLSPNMTSYVTQTGTIENPIFNFGIVKGNTGERGPQGIQGERGPQGIQGQKGDKGQQGIQGDKGPKGDKGDTGQRGQKGDIGLQGQKGDKGDPGQKGIQGPKGDKGDKGEQGIQGLKGDTGEQGPKGDTGERGQDGHTPEKGIDYWTQQDQQNIIFNVLASQTITDIEQNISTLNININKKTDKVTNATNGNFASLDNNGNLIDSGHKHSDYITSHQDVSGKADKVQSATSGNFAGLDANGNLIDSGCKASDFLTQHQTIPVTDVQVNGSSILSEGVANVPKAIDNSSTLGVVGTETSFGIRVNSSGKLYTYTAGIEELKKGVQAYKPIVPAVQHSATFYGLAKAAGDITQSASANAVGVYTDEAKKAIRKMLGIPNMKAELINEVTVAEDSTEIIVDTDSNGQAFKLRKLVAIFDAGPSTTGARDNFYIQIQILKSTTQVSTATSVPTVTYPTATSRLYAKIMIDAIPNMPLSVNSVSGTSEGNSNNLQVMPKAELADYISSIKIYQSSSTKSLIPAGAKLTIYGIRYDD